MDLLKHLIILVIIKKIDIWEIELTPDNNFIPENNHPDWYGYQKIDEK